MLLCCEILLIIKLVISASYSVYKGSRATSQKIIPSFALPNRERHANERVMHNELKKLSVLEKKKLAKNLLEEVEIEENGAQYKHSFQGSDFENPLNTCPPAISDKVRRRMAYTCISKGFCIHERHTTD